MPSPHSSDVALPSFYSPRPAATHGAETPTDLSLAGATITPSESNPQQEHQSQDQVQQQLLQPIMPPPPLLLSPSFTPPQTPGTATPSHPHASVTSSAPQSVPVDSSDPNGGCGNKKPRLMERLPTVTCQVRARIPTTTGTEMFLYLYENDVDDKEHLAIVFGNGIRSESLDRVREGETEMARMIRGAYTGRLFPGRTSSGMANGKTEQQGEAKVMKGEEKEDQRVDNGPRYKADGTPDRSHIPLVRIHSECYTGETAWSARCDCGEQLDEAARLMSQSPSGGIIIYLRQEGRGIGLGEKLKAYNLQDLGNDTVEANLILRHPADKRSYGLATSMLRDLGCREVRLLTNNPEKVRAVEGPGREVVVRERVAMVPLAWRGNQKGVKGKEVEEYLKTKIEKMGHMLSLGP